ncbi:hypothetical protein L7F22_004868 [Adiantum nelumboides]|nr:hypothetical protein [Adiantum nelumboides]
MEEDVAPRRRRVQKSPTPPKRKRSPHSPPRRESKKEEKDTKKKKERKRSPSSPSSSPSSSSDESGGSSSRESPRRGHRRSHAAWRRSNKLKKFKEGGKSISFFTYDGTFGATDKVLAFIQQFDAAFGDEGFTESSKLRHVAMHFQKSARQWWASLRANGEAPRTWKNLRVSIMKQFLSSDAKDKVLTEWQSLKLTPYESIQKYVDKFWDLHLKATVYRKIDFEEQKQQFCAGLPEDMNEYVNSQRPKTISAVIHHTMVAAKINFQQGAKRNLKPMEIKEKHEHKGKNQPQNSSKGNSSNNKAKEKGVYKGKNRLTPEELERYRKDNRCFKCGEQGHAYRTCPQRNARNEQPRASIIEAPKEDVHCKGSPLSYAWGKVREHDAFILFDPGSTHNFISHELAIKLGIQDFEMGDAMKADGAFVGQDASVTPLIGKLRLHIQGYVDKEDFFISPLKHEDVILGAPWFDRLAASIKFPERRISFKFREKNMYIDAQESGNTIPLVHTHAFDKSIKSSISVYMIFVKDSLNDVNKTQVNESGSKEDLELSKFLNQFQDVFIGDIPGELPPKRGDDDHAIELIPGSSPPNKPPYRVSQAQQEEIMRQVNELVEKGMVRPSSSPFCSPVLLVHKKDGTYRMTGSGNWIVLVSQLSVLDSGQLTGQFWTLVTGQLTGSVLDSGWTLGSLLVLVLVSRTLVTGQLTGSGSEETPQPMEASPEKETTQPMQKAEEEKQLEGEQHQQEKVDVPILLVQDEEPGSEETIKEVKSFDYTKFIQTLSRQFQCQQVVAKESEIQKTRADQAQEEIANLSTVLDMVTKERDSAAKENENLIRDLMDIQSQLTRKEAQNHELIKNEKKMKEQLKYEEARYQKLNALYNKVKSTLTALLQNQEPAAAEPSTSDSAALNTMAALQAEFNTEKLQRQLLVSGFMSQTHSMKQESSI